MGNEEGWVGVVAWWDWFDVEFVDMCNVLWSYCCNLLGGTCSGDSRTVVIVVCGSLCTAILTVISWE
jgi:hypothetical protein